MKQFEIAPSEFWKMKPRDFWWLYKSFMPQNSKRGLTKSKARELVNLARAYNAAKPKD